MSLTSAIGKGIGLENILGPQDIFIKKATEQQELMLEEYKDKTDVKENKLSAITDLQTILTDIKTKASILTNPLQPSFDKRVSTAFTQDTGSADDYLVNIRVDDSALTGDVKIAVQQEAKAAELVLASAVDTGFAKGAELHMEGTITLTVGGNARDIVIAGADTVEQIVAKINQEFNAASDKFEAFLIEGNNNTSFIEIRAKETGAGNITVAYDALFVNAAHTQNEQAGEDAIIYVNGVNRTQSSNKFSGVVQGLSFELSGKANSANAANANYNGLNYNTIRVKEDHSAVKKMIIDFGNSLNELSYFIQKHQQSSRSVTADKHADPSKLMDSYDSKDAALRGSSLLTEAMGMLERFTTSKAAGASEITSIYELGMNLKGAVKDGVSYEVLYFEDEGKFTKLFEDEFDKVRRFFITDTKITSTPGNASYLQYLPGEFDRQITDMSIVGKDLPVSITFAGGAVTNFTVTVNGAELEAEVEPDPLTGRYNVSFATDSILHGMEFSVDPKTANNGIENYTINYSSGLANLIQNDARAMISDDGLSGSTITEGNSVQEEIKKLSEESARVEKELQEFTAKLQQEYQAVMQMDMMAAIQMSMIEAALSALTGGE